MSRICIILFSASLAFSILMCLVPLYAIPAMAALGVGCFLHFHDSKNKIEDATLLARVEHLEKTAALHFGGRR